MSDAGVVDDEDEPSGSSGVRVTQDSKESIFKEKPKSKGDYADHI